MYGDDWDYANNRLAGTVVRLGDEPVFVHYIGEGMVARLSKLSSLYEDFEEKANLLDLKPVSLGMCNCMGKANYLSRIPMRRDWKQGLRKENFISHTHIPNALIPPDILGLTIQGKYPTFKECLASFKDKKVESIAWHRHWAVDRNMDLLYKDEMRPVGKYIDGVYVLNEEFKHLQEALEESL